MTPTCARCEGQWMECQESGRKRQDSKCYWI